jgi:5-formyltetrahydrofolate cyclo-ligase
MSTTDKSALRRQALDRRDLAHEAAVEETHDGLNANMLDLLSDKGFLTEGTVIAGYWPINSEADPVRILEDLLAAKVTVALPAIVDGDLVFRAISEGVSLTPGPLGTQEPPAHLPSVRPKALIVPTLAFDLRGARLGYGKGYYDRALRALRATGPVFATGLAYEAQRVDILPWESWDEPLDAAVTEIRVREFSRSAR